MARNNSGLVILYVLEVILVVYTFICVFFDITVNLYAALEYVIGNFLVKVN